MPPAAREYLYGTGAQQVSAIVSQENGKLVPSELVYAPLADCNIKEATCYVCIRTFNASNKEMRAFSALLAAIAILALVALGIGLANETAEVLPYAVPVAISFGIASAVLLAIAQIRDALQEMQGDLKLIRVILEKRKKG